MWKNRGQPCVFFPCRERSKTDDNTYEFGGEAVFNAGEAGQRTYERVPD